MLGVGCRSQEGAAVMSGGGGEAWFIGKRIQGASRLELRELSVFHLSPTLSEKILTFLTKSSTRLCVLRSPLEPPTPGSKAHFCKPLLDRGTAWPVYVTGQPPLSQEAFKIHVKLA